ncbi:hypothetical protein HF290_16980 [Acidithiobacillus ferrooxidans]|uniref:LPD7 domain-containing protein n=1 Tax=Acidithiobacillus ferrooxidans TaxID=920 RepID=UPI001C0725C8|nr:LPD7 domain-containing protein [Acidithiobacillus ferrooxidans]MBU2862010.1 hypothetical protein [Acidithiobacillus ferrooxidans]
MAEEKSLWALSAGDQKRVSGKSRSATFMYSNMDELAQGGNGPAGGDRQPIIIETEDDKVLGKAAEYAAQKGYDLASADPEQNLKIITKQNAMAGEDIAEGQLEPSIKLQKGVGPLQAVDPDVEKQKALEQLTADKAEVSGLWQSLASSDDPDDKARDAKKAKALEAEITEREKAYREKGWLPPASLPNPEEAAEKALEQDDPVADIAKIAEQTKALPDPFAQPEQGVQNPVQQQAQDFPEFRPAKTLAHRWSVPTAKDHGNRIVITRMGMLAVTPPQKRERHDLVSAALLKSRERFGEPVRVTGNKAFENAVIKAAIEQGIPLEMGSDRGEKAYALALANEKKRGLEKAMGTLTPSKERGAPERPTATIPPAKAKGQSRELAR